MEYGDVFVTSDAGPALWEESTAVAGTRVLSLVASFASRRVGVVTEGVRALPSGEADPACVRWIREPQVGWGVNQGVLNPFPPALPLCPWAPAVHPVGTTISFAWVFLLWAPAGGR